jgi:hypothetical protein
MFGNEIKIGDMVAYPVRQSSSLWMGYGKVIELIPGLPYLQFQNTAEDKMENYMWKRPPSLSVMIRTKHWKWNDATQTGENTTGRKCVRVTKLDRAIVVPLSQFSKEEKDFFYLYENPMTSLLTTNG